MGRQAFLEEKVTLKPRAGRPSPVNYGDCAAYYTSKCPDKVKEVFLEEEELVPDVRDDKGSYIHTQAMKGTAVSHSTLSTLLTLSSSLTRG